MNNKKNTNQSIREKDFEMFAKVILVLTIVGIIVSSILIFSPPIGGKEFAELGLLTYNSTTEQYEADNYPTSVEYNQTAGVSEDITLYFLLGNHYHSAQFFDVRLKLGLQNVTITPEIHGTNTNTYFYEDYWLKHVLAVDQIWGPSSETEVTFTFTSAIINKLSLSSNGYKIIFELWQWSSQFNNFRYTGIFTYLTSFVLTIVL